MSVTLKEMRMPIALIGLMFATRFHHFGGSFSLPDASLAAFFFAGLWVRGWKLFGFLLVEAALIDYVAIAHFSVNDYCISPAYVFLIPTYAALWAAGRYCTKYKSIELSTVTTQFGILLAATSVAFFISNGSFYFLSGKFADLNLIEYASRVAKYYLPYMNYTVVYSVVIFTAVKAMDVWLSTSENSAVEKGQ